ncbi:hypothetical protein ACQPZ8_11805 [Actinomadura nitritigenes]|uniref:hypothetical protein n=1 Tax=Actinomadura nitritigenes TaxID=134602 RepID=UPI003D8B636C
MALLGVAVLGMLLAVEFLTVLLFDLDADHGAIRAAFRFAMAGFTGGRGPPPSTARNAVTRAGSSAVPSASP